MPIEVGIWRLGDKPERIDFTRLDAEKRLEDALDADLSIVAPGFMLLGRQIQTDNGKYIDLLAIDSEGNLAVIELKRNRTPREVVAQVLDYAYWVQNLTYGEIADIYSLQHNGIAFEKGFAEAFDINPPEKLNQSHSLIVVASELDPSTERIINYLIDNYDVPLNAVFFRCFKEGGNEYLTRSWLIDPNKAEVKRSGSGKNKRDETWNGRDFYVSLGEDHRRNWEDCQRYGFVTGGGGKWYSQSLYRLFTGARVFVCIPKLGYVGVGTVTGPAVPFRDFRVCIDGEQKSLREVSLKAPQMDKDIDNDEMCEHVVPIEWIKTLPREQAFRETGLFANQNTACKLRNKFTLDRLVKHFNLEE